MDSIPVKSCVLDTMEQMIPLTGSKELAKWWKQREIESLVLELENLSIKPQK